MYYYLFLWNLHKKCTTRFLFFSNYEIKYYIANGGIEFVLTNSYIPNRSYLGRRSENIHF